MDIRYIERENKGKKICGKDLGPVVLPAKVSRDVSVEDFLRTVLDWMPSWLKEQKRFREPPRVHGELAVHRLEDLYACGSPIPSPQICSGNAHRLHGLFHI